MAIRWFSLAILLAAPVPLGAAASAQEGLATSSTIQGHNTIQQAPSGGRVFGNADGGLSNPAPQGLSDAQERALERQNNAATQICKGC